MLQPKKVRTEKFAERLREAGADAAVVVAYGRILPVSVLTAPRLGCVNVHASLLPKLRGAAPIQWAIVRGDRQAGVCLMQMDEGMDTGPELSRRQLEIGPEETAGELSERLARLGGQLITEDLPKFFRGELSPKAQDHDAATLAPMLRKEDGLVDFSRAAQEVHDLVRGMAPWPGAYCFLGGKRVKLHRTRVVSHAAQTQPPGTVLRADRHGVDVACGEGVVGLTELQPEGRKRQAAGQFVAGHRLQVGSRFDSTDDA